MKLRIPNEIKARISGKLLDIAEVLPTFNGSVISMFQIIRKQQREDAEKTYNESRLPEGCQIKYAYLRLIEFYPIEDINWLINNLMRLFPDDSESDSLASIPQNSKRLIGISWRTVGTLGRLKRPFFTTRFREFSELPVEFDYITIGLSQLLPSIFIATFDAHLSAEGQTQLQKLQDGHYLRPVVFTKTIPVREQDWGHSSQ